MDITTEHEGTFVQIESVSIGTVVKANAIIGRVRRPFNFGIDDIRTSEAGTVEYLCDNNTRVDAGELVATLNTSQPIV